MKKLIALVLVLVCVLSLVGCSEHQPNGHDTAPHPDAYIVIEVSETNLLVAEIGEDGKAIEEKQYSVPNVFHPSNKIVVGDQVIINHNGKVKETFPVQFGQIYSMEYYNHETGLNTVVNID